MCFLSHTSHISSAQEPPGVLESSDTELCRHHRKFHLTVCGSCLYRVENGLLCPFPCPVYTLFSLPRVCCSRSFGRLTIDICIYDAQSCRGIWRGGVCSGLLLFFVTKSLLVGGLQACRKSPAAVASRHRYLSGETRRPNYGAS